jgi:hypothetical protein
MNLVGTAIFDGTANVLSAYVLTPARKTVIYEWRFTGGGAGSGWFFEGSHEASAVANCLRQNRRFHHPGPESRLIRRKDGERERRTEKEVNGWSIIGKV